MQHIEMTDELSFSRLVYGWWRLMDWNLDANAIVRRLEDCLTLGITTHDHADIYGDYQCEAHFGQALKLQPSLRAQIQLVTKCGIQLVSEHRPNYQRKNYDTRYQHIVASAEQSLKNLCTDYVDVLLIHRPDPLLNADEVARAFGDLHAAGKVRAFGVSNFNADQYAQLQSRLSTPLITNQLEISVLHHHSFHDGSLDQAQTLRRPPMAWSALAGGRLFNAEDERARSVRDCLQQLALKYDCSIDQLALAWLLKHPAHIMPIVGSGSLARIQSACGSLDVEMSRDDWYTLWEANGGELP
ncbi:aldo/keto reductase [Simiduia aestuariiviva]|uniref:Putative oxidoreductase n=1 Tax=Simiduia aestuariiviva TaxID=1510459 RepID=A0A839UQX3_9GAMM|nr:aldo/keto reductase [Simiduia aestuariiviva]MBB3170183.1 putative oxidoreductase [Simiduia aestuariiviva]